MVVAVADGGNGGSEDASHGGDGGGGGENDGDDVGDDGRGEGVVMMVV